MQKQIKVLLGKGVEFTFPVPDSAALTHEAARVWLDQQFTSLECEPLRASGKVLTVDKVLVVTQAAGAKLLGDAKWAAEFVAAVSTALGKPMINIDVPAMAVTF